MIDKVDPDKDGTNTVKSSVSTHYQPKTVDTNSSNTANALIMGYLIDFRGGYRINTRNNGNAQSIYDYSQVDNNTPTRGLYKVRIYNQDKGGADGENAAAKIDTASTANSLDQFYRLEHIYLPAFFLDDQWFKVRRLNITVNGKTIPVIPTKDAAAPGWDGTNYYYYVGSASTVEGESVYTIDVESIIRNLRQKDANFKNILETYTNTSNSKTYTKARPTSFQLDFAAVNPKRDDATTVLGDGQYLTADKTAARCTYMYDGVYVDRTAEKFDADVWDSTSTPDFGKDPNAYDQRYSPSTLSVTFTSIDPNANVFQYYNVDGSSKGASKTAYYYIKNLLGMLQMDIQRSAMYDLNVSGEKTKVDFLHLSPYDYVEYILSAGADGSSLLPLEHMDLQFAAPEGQRIVKWEVVDANGNVLTNKASANVPVDGITATLAETGTSGKKITANKNVDYSYIANDNASTGDVTGPAAPEGVETAFRQLNISVGANASMDLSLIHI